MILMRALVAGENGGVVLPWNTMKTHVHSIADYICDVKTQQLVTIVTRSTACQSSCNNGVGFFWNEPISISLVFLVIMTR